MNSTTTQLSISVSQKTTDMLYPLIPLYGGAVYKDNGLYVSYKWYITRRNLIIPMIEYFKLCPSRSEKKNRINLLPRYYELKGMKAHKAEVGTLLNKE